MSFYDQTERAQTLTNAYQRNYDWLSGSGPVRDQEAVTYGSKFADYELEKGFESAYANKDGYAIRKNPISRKNEMYVRGTNLKGYGREWLSNALEVLPRGVAGVLGLSAPQELSLRARRKHASYLDSVAKRNDVDAVLGHSRGAAVVSDMTFRKRKVGVDGAMILAKRGRRGFTNYRQTQPFDAFIGIGAGKTKKVRGPWNPRSRRFHKAYLN